MKNQKGFTLVELLVVITIISVLATIGMTSYRSATTKARDARRESEIQQLRSSLEAFRTVQGNYPIQAVACNSTGSPACWNTLMTSLATYISGPAILDPKNDSTLFYTYQTNATGTTYTIRYRKEILSGSETNPISYSNP